MRLNPYIFALPALLSLSVAPVFAAPVSDTPFQDLKSYDYQNRKPVEAIQEMIRTAPVGGPEQAEIETKLLAVFEDPAATFAAKQEVGRMLREIGTARSMPVLAKALSDEKLGDVARYALEGNADPSAGKALRSALSVAKGNALVGVISSIGSRRDPAAVGNLKPLLHSPDPAVSNAAIAALGKIGTREAATTLQALPNKSLLVYQSWLAGADWMQAHKQGAEALGIYRRILQDKSSPAPARLAATRGVLIGDPVQAASLILTLLRGSDPELQRLAARAVRELPPGTSTSALMAGVEKLPPAGEALLLGALAGRGDSALLPVLMRAAASPDAAVRLAALHSFAALQGNAAAAMLLAKTAVNAADGEEKRAAQTSLYRMPGAAVDQAVVAALPKADPEVRNELVRAIGQRYITNAKPLLFRWAADPDPSVQSGALSALNSLATGADYPAAVKLLLEASTESARSADQNLVLRLSKQLPSEGDRTAPLIAGLSGASPETKASLFKVLSAMGGTTALDAVRAGTRDTDPKVQDAAIRALAGSQDPAVMNDLLEIAKASSNNVHRVLALRGYLQLAEKAPNAGAGLYAPVIKLATDADQKRTIISGLTRVNTPDALALVVPMLDDESVRNEAALAVISIARNITAKNPQEAKTALQRVITAVKDDNIVKQANDALKNI